MEPLEKAVTEEQYDAHVRDYIANQAIFSEINTYMDEILTILGRIEKDVKGATEELYDRK